MEISFGKLATEGTPEASAACSEVVNTAVSSPAFDEPWAPLHNFQVWHTDPDGTYSWRNDATGFSYEQ